MGSVWGARQLSKTSEKTKCIKIEAQKCDFTNSTVSFVLHARCPRCSTIRSWWYLFQLCWSFCWWSRGPKVGMFCDKLEAAPELQISSSNHKMVNRIWLSMDRLQWSGLLVVEPFLSSLTVPPKHQSDHDVICSGWIFRFGWGAFFHCFIEAPAATLHHYGKLARDEVEPDLRNERSHKNASRDTHAFIRRWGLSWKVPLSYVEVDQNGEHIKFAFIKPSNFIKFLINTCSRIVNGGLRQYPRWTSSPENLLGLLQAYAPNT